MFTGIIQAVGTIAELQRQGSDCTLVVNSGQLDLSTTRIGDSIAVNGVCLTVTTLGGNRFTADASNETLAHSSLGMLRAGSLVNLEKALTLTTPLGGHLVSGHVDDLGEIIARQDDGRSVRFSVRVPAQLSRYIAAKGSITIDGISLTVNSIENDTFSVNIIPQTIQETTLRQARIGQHVNIEVDLIARYLERLILNTEPDSPSNHSGLTLETLAQSGFLSTTATKR